MTYCGNCGQLSSGGAFCSACGQRLQARLKASTSVPSPSPSRSLADVLTRDLARDAGAMALLLLSLALPWTGESDGAATDKVYVILATIISIGSLSLPYLVRAGALGSHWTPGQSATVRLLLNVPYAAVVVVTIGLDIAATTGLGVGVAVGLAGAVLAAQPRESELGTDEGPTAAAWWRGTVGLGAASAGLGLLTLLVGLFVIRFGTFAGITTLVLLSLVPVAIACLLGFNLERRDPVWRLMAVALGLQGLLIALWASSAGTGMQQAVSVRAAGWWSPMLLWPAVGAAALSPPVLRSIPGAGTASELHAFARLCFLTMTAVGGVLLVIQAVGLVSSTFARGPHVVYMLVLLATVVAAFLAQSLLRQDTVRGQPVALSVAVGAGFVALVVFAARDANTLSVSALDLMVFYGMPLSAAGWLLLPVAARAHLEAGAVGTGASPAAAVPDSSPPLPPPANGDPPASDDAVLAADPSTPPATLAQLAQHQPRLWPLIAANPATYPELLEWLAQRGDPSVDAALQRRREAGRQEQ